MLDITFYENTYNTMTALINGESFDKDSLIDMFENARRKNPIVYNIETTNACNMKCQMCPRTTKMTRPIETMGMEMFENIVEQLSPFANSEWEQWKSFVKKTYDIDEGDMSENHFFLYIIPKVIQLHGYGDPLLDRSIAKRVRFLTDQGLNSYFSCNPANINVDKTERIFNSGLSYIKYSIESIDDVLHKKIRGRHSDFSESYDKIIEVLDRKVKHNYDTTIIITMLDLNNDKQQEEYDNLEAAFKGLDVYIYLKSQDQQWYNTAGYHGTNSVHWSEICRHPWMTMTIKSDGGAAMCMEDYNNEIILGNTKEDTLYNIWNGEKYTKLRRDHFDLTPNIKCTEECDMKMVGRYLK